ncbi:hypothetical protein [Vibrio phage vB_ValS_PJ32]|nr:hypothetical protein [Vibrio phage vB_ValS_PJ32]
MGRSRTKREEQSNAELIKYHKAHNRFKDSKLSLCEANQDIAQDEKGVRTYKCTMCNTFKKLDDFNEFQQIRPFGRICAVCQGRPTRLNLDQ